MRKLIDANPFAGERPDRHKHWPINWIGELQPFDGTPRITAFRKRFEVPAQASARIHVSADERYELYLDGMRIGRGPERGDRSNWFFETYDLQLAAGRHTLVALTWWLGSDAPFAQMTVRHGLLVAAEDSFREALTTGAAAWECKRLSGYSMLPTGQAWGCGAKLRIDGARYDWGWERGAGRGWKPVIPIGPAITLATGDEARIWRLRPALLPAMTEEPVRAAKIRLVSDAVEFPFHDDEYKPQPPVRSSDNLVGEFEPWNRVLDGNATVGIGPHTCRRILIDLDNYYCARPQLVVSGGRGALIRVSWAESLYDRLPIASKSEWIGNMPKGDRNAVEGKYFHGVTDEFLPDGAALRRYETLWWEAGRFVQVLIRTGDESLRIESLEFAATSYPCAWVAEFESSDSSLEPLVRPALRSLLACSHDTYMDCPYYEQLMYIGDARIEALTTYASAADSRLPRKAVELLDLSRDITGLTQSRYPSRITQYIWTFSLFWIGMVHDWLMWRGDLAFAKARMPGVRSVLDTVLSHIGNDGLLHIDGGGFDWVAELNGGRDSSLQSLLLTYALNTTIDLEHAAGEPEMAARWARHRDSVMNATIGAFWHPSRGLFCDDLHGERFSEHAQSLALLSGCIPDAIATQTLEGLIHDPDLLRTTISFRHYLFEALKLHGRVDALLDRLDPWKDSLAHGYRCLPEMFEPTRSDCHAWGSHIVYHFLASVLGIGPSEPGFASVEIKPDLGPLEWAEGTMAHPLGSIHVRAERTKAGVRAKVLLPAGLSGRFVDHDRVVPLHPGFQEVA